MNASRSSGLFVKAVLACSILCSFLLLFLGTLKLMVLFSGAPNWNSVDPILPLPKRILLPSVGALEIVVGAATIAVPRLRFISFALLSGAFIAYRTVLFVMLKQSTCECDGVLKSSLGSDAHWAGLLPITTLFLMVAVSIIFAVKHNLNHEVSHVKS